MLKRTVPYVSGYALLFVVMAVLLAAFSKGELHIMLNSVHTQVGDVLLKHFSRLAEWPLYVLGGLPLFFRLKWWVAFYAACESASAIVVTALKHMFNMPRPSLFFQGAISEYLPVVEGVKLHRSLSFPSGHTSTFFIFVTVAVILLSLRCHYRQTTRLQGTALYSCQLALLLLAAVGGYSRIYLSQHFLMDVFAGSIIGICIPFALYPLFAAKLKESPTHPVGANE